MRTVNDERGVVSVLTCVLLAFVLIGCAALTIDISALHQERRTLQNGADAAALAVAKDCVTGPNCGSYTSTADSYADLNADDGQHNIDLVCGTGPGLPACAAGPSVPAGAKYVKVTDSTLTCAKRPCDFLDPDNRNEVPFLFAPILDLISPGGHDGKTVHATTAVAWGSPGQASTLPLTFSQCEFQEYVPDVTALPKGPPFSGAESEVDFHGSAEAGTCPTTPSGQNLPGGFGWLDPNSSCLVDISAGGWAPSSTGVPAPNCVNLNAIQNTTVLLPIYDQDAGNGANGQYHIVGFAAFYITGYKFTGQDKWPNNIHCQGNGNSGTCIKGHFVGFTTTGTGFGGPDMGVTIFKIVE